LLTQLFLDFQSDATSDSRFVKLAGALRIKMLSVFKSIGCSATYREDFLQSCCVKILDVVHAKNFNCANLNDKILNRYFERAFLSVKGKFIREHELYRNHISLDAEDENGIALLEKVSDCDQSAEIIASDHRLCDIKAFIPSSDYAFLRLFIGGDEGRMLKMAEVAKMLSVSHQAVSKRFKRIKRKVGALIDR